MIPLALLLALAPQRDLARQGDLAPNARAQARVEARASAVEVGEPFELELVVRHTAGDAPAVDPAALEADPAWAVLGGGARTTLADPDREGLELTHASWSLVALEAGTHALPSPALSFAVAGGQPEPFEVERGSLEVVALLAPGEDEPRPLGDFLGLGPEPSASGWLRALPWLVALALAGAAGLVVGLQRRRRPQPSAALLAPLQRLAALDSADLGDAEAIRGVHHELVHCLRRHVERELGVDWAGRTDEEWVRSLAERVGVARAQPFEELLRACEPVRYGGEEPTHWATRERVARARELAAGLAQARAATEVAA